MSGSGILYLVATPIGNLEDITFRAVRILREVDLIAAEDTRQTIKLLNHFDIRKPMVSYHEHNKKEKGGYLIDCLLEGKSIALVSDAGSPGISDPGEELVKLAAERNIEVTMAPGPSAVIMGLVVSGLPAGRFVFEGFLPVNKRARKERIEALRDETRTVVFYEAPHKLLYTLKDLLDILGDRRIALARELTKKFEQVIRTTLSQAYEMYGAQPPKGEYVLVLEGRDENELAAAGQRKWEELSLKEHVERYIGEGYQKKEAIKKVAEDRGLRKSEVYNSIIGQ